MSNALKALMRGSAPTVVNAEAIDFDGTNDYMSRASDLTGNADGKTFTFSAWVWVSSLSAGLTNGFYYVSSGGNLRFRIQSDNNQITGLGYNSAGTSIFTFQVTNSSDRGLAYNTWNHLLVSIDLASTANRYVYINDVAATTAYTTYNTSGIIDFTGDVHEVGRTGVSQAEYGRLAHVFLDYQYRNLSTESERRKFITADRKPVSKASLAALNPILYLPMDDPTTAHVNLGTGGNFTLNGTIARSGRGPNQYNTPYSDLDGAADYLSRTSITGIADGKQFTFHCVFNVDTTAGDKELFYIGDGANIRFRVIVYANGQVDIYGYSTSSTVLHATLPSGTIVSSRNYALTASIDLSNAVNRYVCLNGAVQSPTWHTYTDNAIDFAPTTPYYAIGALLISGSPSNYFNGRLGDVFFHTSYIDLSVPANLAKFVTGTGIDAKPVDMGANGELPLGVQPLIYLPMYGNNAGKNYGTGGDFTVNSGPYPGARGPNEFWGNKADFDGTTGYLVKSSSNLGMSSGKTFSMSFWLTIDAGEANGPIMWQTGSGDDGMQVYWESNVLYVKAVNSAGTVILNWNRAFGTAFAGYFQLCIDLTSTSLRRVYMNGTDAGGTWTTYTNDTISFGDVTQTKIGSISSDYLDGKLSEFYFTTEYIDFSQEANRLKFRDAFGSPVALLPQIQAGSIPNPAIYMRFDPADQGKNEGTGGNFTKSGTINDGGQL